MCIHFFTEKEYSILMKVVSLQFQSFDTITSSVELLNETSTETLQLERGAFEVFWGALIIDRAKPSKVVRVLCCLKAGT